MELKPLTIEAILHRGRDQAAQRMTAVILQARIGVTSQEFALLEIQAVHPMEIIHF